MSRRNILKGKEPENVTFSAFERKKAKRAGVTFCNILSPICNICKMRMLHLKGEKFLYITM